MWDKNNVQKNQDGSITVLSKFLPKSRTEITHEILPNWILIVWAIPLEMFHSEQMNLMNSLKMIQRGNILTAIN